ncbi:MAG: hypothetical protein C4532_19430 [Candidatus Abyssobacteria bacterium SURF_17]|jgi:hypothetical protein|uniref:Uncharacterized protein n=1 Tax=Candidatus Abyssobacteria bacterium SURF_17 TaxID=2093361 RepID=A0A419END7_9BACT|nr:MAG: hypothetical protein C4532_19430 [Candidatus Abyssubacteria bacterium SURF_17]
MKLDKKTVLAIVLGIVAVGVVVYRFGGVIPSGTNAVGAVADASAVSAARSLQSSASLAGIPAESATSDYEGLIATITEKDVAFRRNNFRDPMTALVTDAKDEEGKFGGPAANVALGPTDALSMGYTIEGIVWNEVEPMAIVNNQVVGVGEQLDDGAFIAEITNDTVTFMKDGNSYYLIFREE